MSAVHKFGQPGDRVDGPPRSVDSTISVARHQPSTVDGLPNGVGPTNDDGGRPSLSAAERMKRELPPELPHIAVNYFPLSRLFERAAQDCFKSLNETLNDISTLPDPHQVNGDVPAAGAGNTSPANVERKLRWMNFANHHRERFIKLLVLLQWSKNVGDISKVIDLVAWMHNHQEAYDAALWSIGALKRDMTAAKLPNPDIETALEVLSTGKSSRMPDLGYIPPPPLSPAKLLKTLKNLNILLHIRLHLHEELPQNFRSFSIASGRATFRVADEFEVDLSIADEDPASQFFFIDFRFLFSPRSEIPPGQLQSELEGRINQVLASEGLAGCYSFLHEFVLTHKLNVLRKQAIEMNRSAWEGSIRVEQLHRTLVVQYWTTRPGPKSWIEIGVVANRSFAGSSSDGQPSMLSIQWTRDGKKVPNADLPLDVQTLSMEATLKMIIARHISHIFSQTRKIFADKVADPAAAFALSTSETEPSDCALRIPLELGETTTLLMEPVTGEFAFCPASMRSMRCQDILNNLKDPALDAFSRLQDWRAVELAQKLRGKAEDAGWKSIRPDLHKRTLEQRFGSDIIRTCFFVPPSLANSGWSIAAVIGPVRETWWRVKIVDNDVTSVSSLGTRPDGSLIAFAQKLEVARASGKLSESFLEQLSDFAVLTISFQEIRGKLQGYGLSSALFKSRRPSSKTLPALHIKLSSDVDQPSRSTQLGPLPGSSRQHTVVLHHYGIESETQAARTTSLAPRNVVHIATGTMTGPQYVFDLLASNSSSDISFTRNGQFALLIRTPLGSNKAADTLIARMRSLLKLRKHVEVMKKHDYTCQSLSPDRVVFTYAKASDHTDIIRDLQCSLTFEHGRGRLRFPSREDPHRRIQSKLERLFNPPSSLHDQTMAFTYLAVILALTLQPLLALSQLEHHDRYSRSLVVHAHDIFTYKLVYKRPRCAFTIETVKRRGRKNDWSIRRDFDPLSTATEPLNGQANEMNNRTGPGSKRHLVMQQESRNPKLRDALKSFCSEQVEGRIPLRTGVVVTNASIQTTLLALDALVRNAADGEEEVLEEPDQEEMDEELDSTVASNLHKPQDVVEASANVAGGQSDTRDKTATLEQGNGLSVQPLNSVKPDGTVQQQQLLQQQQNKAPTTAAPPATNGPQPPQPQQRQTSTDTKSSGKSNPTDVVVLE